MSDVSTNPVNRIGQAALQGTVVAAWVAVPDYARGRVGRFAARSALLAGVVAGSVALDRYTGQGAEPARMREFKDQSAAFEDGLTRFVPRQWVGAAGGGIAAAALAASVLVNRLENKALDAAATGLSRRGVRRPRLLIGVGLGVAAGVAAYVEN